MRRRLPAGVRMYTGDDFNYAELIAGDERGLFGRAARHLRCDRAGGFRRRSRGSRAATAAASTASWSRPCRCRAISSRRRRGSTRPASCSSPGSTACRSISSWSAARRAPARCCTSPNCSAWPTRRACCTIPSWRPRAWASCSAVHGLGVKQRRLMPTDGLSINLATVRAAMETCAAVEACARARHPRGRAVARPGGGDRRSRRRRASSGERHAGDRLLPRRDVPGRATRPARAARSTTTGARSTRRRRSAPSAWCWSCGGLPTGSRDLAGARQRWSRRHGGDAAACARRRVPLAIEPLHPMYAADRACVNTLAQALDLCDAARARASASRSTPITSGGTPSSRRRSRARAAAHPRAPHLRLAGADPRHAATTAA